MSIVVRVWLAISVTIFVVVTIGASIRVAQERDLLLEVALRDRRVSAEALQTVFRGQSAEDAKIRRATRIVDHQEAGDSDVRARIVSLDSHPTWPRLSLDPELAARLRRGRAEVTFADGTFVTYIPIDDDGRALLELAEPDEARALVTRIGLWSLALQSFALSSLAGVTVFLVLRLLVGRPLALLTTLARRIGSGELEARVAFDDRRDEVAELAREMNRMAEALATSKRHIDDLEAERTEALEQLRHADRLRTAGQLASALAHELGTPLNVVSGHARLIEQDAEVPSEPRSSARIVLEQTARMTRTLRELLGFVRQRGPNVGRHDLVELARGAVQTLMPLARRRRVDLTVDADERVLAEVDANQVLQVVTNLIVNGMQASQPESTIRIELSSRGAHPPVGVHARPGRFAVLAVVDEGCGIAPEDLARLFEPFFTRRPEAGGTGLGLAVVDGIVREHRGWIDVTSTVGSGSRFEVHLPIERDPRPLERPSEVLSPAPMPA
jgi:signal transduction histidine kinase